jgi:hypothetical protein
MPVAELLVRGGDSRLPVVAEGLSRYGCSPWPRNVLPFGSCSASSISERGFFAAQHAQSELLGAHDMQAAGEEACRQIRRRLRHLLQLPQGVAIALAPSGTDAELLALALAAGGGRRRVVNIVMGPSEIGTGSPLAAAGRHFDACLPNGDSANVGESVDWELAARVETLDVDLRRADGTMREESDIDDVVSAAVTRAAAAGKAVLLHVVSHGKTGMHAPSLGCVERLRRLHPDLMVVVDAAQGRFSRRGLSRVLSHGYPTLVTGSKFFGGPPFSGALLVPPAFSPARRGLDRLPAGFRGYFTAAEMPTSWQEIRRSLPRGPNYGLVLRWSAALAEMQAYYDAPPEARLHVLRWFEYATPRLLAASPALTPLPVSPPIESATFERLLESKTTVFAFQVRPPGHARHLDKSQLLALCMQLNTDVSAAWPTIDPALARRTFHVGQPVELGEAGHALRVALGGTMIVDVCRDRRLGETMQHRLVWLSEQIVALRRKIEALAASLAPAHEGPR